MDLRLTPASPCQTPAARWLFENSATRTHISISPARFLKALAGPNGEKLVYKKLENCCPFPSKRALSGAGLLDVYEVSWTGNQKPLKIYINIYEKGFLFAPLGLSIRL